MARVRIQQTIIMEPLDGKPLSWLVLKLANIPEDIFTKTEDEQSKTVTLTCDVEQEIGE